MDGNTSSSLCKIFVCDPIFWTSLAWADWWRKQITIIFLGCLLLEDLHCFWPGEHITEIGHNFIGIISYSSTSNNLKTNVFRKHCLKLALHTVVDWNRCGKLMWTDHTADGVGGKPKITANQLNIAELYSHLEESHLSGGSIHKDGR